MLAGVDDRLAHTLAASGLVERLGTGNVVPGTPILFQALDTACAQAQEGLADRREDKFEEQADE